MLRNASSLVGYAVGATDGRIGSISDLLFDDANWSVRWLVIETGNWLSGRKVLLPSSVLGYVSPARDELFVGLTMQQVKDSPDIDVHQPVSRQMESSLYDYYGWNPYWYGGLYMGGYVDIGGILPITPYIGPKRRGADVIRQPAADRHLRSVESVTGYHIHARDGEIGHVEDFLIQDADWGIHYLVVDTRNWWPGKKVLIAPRSVQEISWQDRRINLRVDRQSVKASPAYNAAMAIDRGYEREFHTYYGGAHPGL